MPSRLPIKMAMNDASRIGPRDAGVCGVTAYNKIANMTARRNNPVSNVKPNWKRFRVIKVLVTLCILCVLCVSAVKVQRILYGGDAEDAKDTQRFPS